MNNQKFSLSKKSFVLAVGLHIAIVFIAATKFPFTPKEFSTPSSINVDLVKISELTNLKSTKTIKEPLKKDLPLKTEAQPVPLVKKQETAKKQKEVAVLEERATSSPKAQQLAPKQGSNNVPPHRSESVNQDQLKRVQKKIEVKSAKKDSGEMKNKSRTVKQEQDNYAKMILKSLKSSEAPKRQSQPLEEMFETLENEPTSHSDQPYNPNQEISLSEIDAIRQQIKKTWNTIAFNGSTKAMRVTVFISLDSLGVVLSAHPKLEKSDNSSYGVFVESIIRAIHAASPLQGLSKSTFQDWKEIEMIFSSEEMLY